MSITQSSMADNYVDIKWSGMNNPFKLGQHFIDHFNKLPTEGEIQEKGLAWPGSYWANNDGGIAFRWNSSNPRNFVYESPSLEALRQLSQVEINELSPAEKFDIYNANYHYPLVKKVWQQTSPGHSSWFGICHGFAPASIHHKEPNTVTKTNIDGIQITFYSSDIKALLAYFYAKVIDQSAIQVGSRCYFTWFYGRLFRYCNDIDAGAFHIALTNKVGIEGSTIIADIMRFNTVSNHPVVSYKTIIEEHLNSTQIQVRTIVKYAGSAPAYQFPILNTNYAEYYHEEYKYYLYLNSNGEITGGSWISSNRPDFIWHKKKHEFIGVWKSLDELYTPAI